MRYELVLVPLLTIAAGWLTAWLIVRALLRLEGPRLLGSWQRNGFFSSIEEKIADPAHFDRMLPLIENEVDAFLRVKLPQQMPMIGMLVGERTLNEMKQVFIAELKELFPVVMKNYMNGLQNAEPVQEMLRKPLEQLAEHAARKARMAGAAVGLGVGLVQVIILVLS